MNTQWSHDTVLLEEAVEALHIQPSGRYIDATFGRGGHSTLILKHLGKQGSLLGVDRDPQAVAYAQAWTDERFAIRHQAFHTIADLPEASMDGLLMDLGVSSPQLDDAARGFSFRRDGPLDMRMDTTRGMSVAEWLKDAALADITEVIREYGE
ncbi:MAG: 16S rRNA (cytosine(1402)-N(4))-methyltransferase RsmH, partial [Burkholderiaceae bacterium]